LTDTANNNRSLGAVVKPGKRNSVGRRTADWRHCRADIRSHLSEGVKAIGGNRSDEKQTHNLDHQFLLLHSREECKPAIVQVNEVQNGNHIEAYVVPFPQLVVIQPHAQKAFDLLMDHVESNSPLPPSQCVPKGGAISQSPGASHLGNCADLFVP
jgi:hypothetical protein